MKRNNVLLGALILSISSLFARMVGFVFRIWLSNTMGAEGMGVYSLIMSLYGLSTTVATSGISAGVSKLVAEEMAFGRLANSRRILGRSVTLSLAISCAVAAVLLFCAQPLALHVLKDARCEPSLRMMALGLPFLAVSACIRSYFIAGRSTANPAAGQVIEQVFKMAFIMVLIGYGLPRGLEYGCAVVVLGISVGEVVCLLFSLGGYLLEKRRVRVTGRADIRGVTVSLLRFAVPVCAGSYIRSALRLLEDVLIVSGLQKFSGNRQEATGTYGIMRGMVMPLLTFPLTLLSSFVVTLMPEISRLNAASETRRLERTISKILQYTCIAGVLIVSVFMTFSYELGGAVYKEPQVGEMLRALSFLCPFMCLEMVVVSILQGLGEQVSSVRYGVSDCILRVAMVWALVPSTGAAGFIVMVAVSNLYTALLNLRRLLKITRLHVRWGDWVLKPALAAAAAGQSVKVLCNFYLFRHLPMWQGLAVGLAILTAAYGLVLLALGGVSGEDFQWFIDRLKLSKPKRRAVDGAALPF